MNAIHRIVTFHNHVLDFAKQSGLSEEAALAETRAMGFDGLFADHAALTDRTRQRSLFEGCGLRVLSIFSYIDFLHDEQSACARKTEDLVAAAAAFGTKNVLVIPGVFQEGDDQEAGLDRICAGLTEACRLAKPLAIDVTIEDFGSATSPNKDIAGCLRILERVPDLGFSFDTGNFTCCGEDPHVAYEALKDRTVFVHLKDRPAGPDGHATPGAAAVGDGVLQLDKLVCRMLADGYTGDFVAEHFGMKDQETAMRRSAAFCRRILM